MLCFYLFTERIDLVTKENDMGLSLGQLNSIPDRLNAIIYLAKIYSYPCSLELCALDYKNLYDIFYIICMPNFGNRLDVGRVSLAKKLIQRIKDGQAIIGDLINELLTSNNYI